MPFVMRQAQANLAKICVVVFALRKDTTSKEQGKSEIPKRGPKQAIFSKLKPSLRTIAGQVEKPIVATDQAPK